MGHFELPDNPDELFPPYGDSKQTDYDIPASAIDDTGAVESDPPDEDDPGDAITAPSDRIDDETAVVNEAMSAGSPPDDNDPPPSDRNLASEEFPDPETVLDMSVEERAEVLSDIEQFAVVGYPYSEAYIAVREIGGELIRTNETDTGISHIIPKAALDAEGVKYDTVDVFTADGTDIMPPSVGIVVSRVRPAEVDSFDAQGEPIGMRTVDGLETKAVRIGQTATGVVKIAATSNLVAPITVEPEIDADGNTYLAMDRAASREPAPLLGLQEMRGIVRAIHRIRDNPEAFAPTVEGDMDMPMLGRIRSVRPEVMALDDTPSETPTILDLPQEWQADLQVQMELYASSSSGGRFRRLGLAVTEEGLVPLPSDSGYTRIVTPEELAAEGLAFESGTVTTHEPREHEPYSVTVALYGHEPSIVEVPTRDGLPVRREVSAELTQYVTFSREQMPGSQEPEDAMFVGGALQAPYTPKSETEPQVMIINGSIQAFTQAEAEALMRLLKHANGDN